VKSGAYVIADIDGDSKNDVTDAYVPYLPSTPIGNAWPNPGTLPTPPGYWGFGETTSCLTNRPVETGLRFVDVNADGKADYVQGSSISGTTNFGSWINTYTATSGYSWNGTATGTIPIFDNSNVTTGLFADVNGDGLPDYEEATGGTGYGSDAVYLGNGQ